MTPKPTTSTAKNLTPGQFRWLASVWLNSHITEAGYLRYRGKWGEEFEKDGIGPSKELFHFHCSLCDGDYPIRRHSRAAVIKHIDTKGRKAKDG